jgi:hypothetical protein
MTANIAVNTCCGVYAIQDKKINSLGFILVKEYPDDFDFFEFVQARSVPLRAE